MNEGMNKWMNECGLPQRTNGLTRTERYCDYSKCASLKNIIPIGL